MDRKVLEERLTCRETVVTGNTSVLRVATRLNGLVSALAAAAAASSANAGTDGAAAAVAAAHDALVKELMLMRLEVGLELVLGLGGVGGAALGVGRMHG